MKFLK